MSKKITDAKDHRLVVRCEAKLLEQVAAERQRILDEDGIRLSLSVTAVLLLNRGLGASASIVGETSLVARAQAQKLMAEASLLKAQTEVLRGQMANTT